MREDELMQCTVTCRSLNAHPTPLQSGQLEKGIFLGFPVCLAERKEGVRSDKKRLLCVEAP